MHEDGAERTGGLGVEQVDAVTLGQGVGVLPVAGVDEALAGRAVEGAVIGVADLLVSSLCPRAERARVPTPLARARGSRRCFVAAPSSDGLSDAMRCVHRAPQQLADEAA